MHLSFLVELHKKRQLVYKFTKIGGKSRETSECFFWFDTYTHRRCHYVLRSMVPKQPGRTSVPLTIIELISCGPVWVVAGRMTVVTNFAL